MKVNIRHSSVLFIAIVSIFWNLNLSAQSLNGTYTIGGTSPNYASFTAAVSALTNNGVSGPVVFNVRSGVYIEQISISAITGVTATNSITFQSQTGDSTSVTLTYSPSSSSSNYTVRFNGSDYITFKKLSIKATGASYATVFKYESGSNFNRLENNIIAGNVTTSTTTNQAIIYGSATTLGDNYIGNNVFVDGSIAIYVSSSTSNIQITQNTFQNQYYRALDLTSITNLQISKNTIYSSTSYPYYEGMMLSGCGSNLQVLKNKLNLTNSIYGIYLYSCTANTTTRGLVANNFISISGSAATGYGIYTYNCTYQNVYYNSVNITRPYSGTYAAYITGSSSNNMQLQNNILSNKGGGYALYTDYSGIMNICDYNDLYSNGSYVAYWPSYNCSTLANWRSYSSLDAHSVSVSPDFLSASDLHLQTYQLDNAGYPVSQVSDDIEGQARSLSTPDIGADEWSTPLNDAGATSIDQALTYCILNDSVYANIKNFGTANLTSVKVNWKVNGITQTQKTWTGNLAQGNSFGPFSLGKYTFALGTTYSIYAWTTNPNGAAEGFTYNDTCPVVNKYKAMSGTYTIGGTTPNYATFNAAVTDLINGGVCGPVVFNVRNGLYNEQISIPYISGASALNTITFQSQSGDSTQVVMTYAPTSSYNYTVQLNGCDYVAFRKIKLIANGTTYATVLKIESNSIYNRIDRCILQGVSTTSTSTNLAVIYSSASSITGNVISQNKITNGSIGIYISGNSSTGIQIIQNIVQNQYFRGMDLNSLSQLIVSKNVVNSITTYTVYECIYIYLSGTSLQVTKNILTNINGYYGLSLYNCTASSSTRGLIANNMIGMITSSNSAYGIIAYSCSYQNLYYNTVNISRLTSSSYSFLVTGSSTSNIQLQNNVFSNKGGGFAIYSDYSGVISVSDYNDLYSNGSYTAYWNGNYCPTIATWRSVTGMDVHSVSTSPDFLSYADLHMMSYQLDNLGYPVTGVTDDIDGLTRSLSNPDMGADEWSTPSNDAGAVSIDPILTYCMTNDSIYATIKNYGTSNLTSVTVNWKVNGATQTPKSWTGNLAQGSSYGPFSLGRYSFSLGTSYSIYAWTTNPNGSAEGFTYNDTCQPVNKYKALSGTFTIGGTSPNYATFNDAVTDLINGGVCGPVVFNVRNGIYNEQVYIPTINGTSAVNTIIFQSQSGDSTQVTLTYAPTSSYNYTVQFYGCDYVTFRKMKLIATGATYATVLRIESNSIYNRIDRCILQGVSTTSTSTNLAVIYSSSSIITGNIISQNKITNGSIGIYISGNNSTAVQIIQNSIQNQYYKGMDLNTLSQLTVSKNVVNTNSTYSGYECIYLYLTGAGLQVTKNILINIYGYYGIEMYNCTSSSSARGLIANNMISMITSSSTAYGIYTYNCTYQNFYYNTVNISRPTSSSYVFLVTGSSSNNIQLQNNVFSNKGGGFAIYSDYSGVISISDYNDLYSNGSYTAYWNGNYCPTLATWRSVTGMDVHSLSVSPDFLSSSDLHMQSYQLDNLGYTVSGVTDDIDGQTRSLSIPDMGADEWSTPVNDAGATSIDQNLTYCITNDSIFVNIKNYGTANLTSVTVNWKVNGVTQAAKSWTGNLAQGSSYGPFSIGKYSFSLGTPYSIYAWTTNPNGSAEGFTYNDTCPVVSKYKAMSGTYTIGGTSPNYANFNDAVTDLINSGVCGPVTFNIRNGIYNEQVSIPNINGSSAVNTITFQSQSGDSTQVVLTFAPTSSYNYTVQLYGCDYVTFRKMKLIATGTTYATVLRLESNSIGNKIERCLIQGWNTTSTSNNLAAIYSNASTITNNIFSQNKISDGSVGIYIFGGTSTGIQIVQNVFQNQYYRAMDMNSLSQLIISKNSISSNTTYSGYECMYVYSCGTYLQITKNILNNSIGYYGIDLYSCTSSSSSRGLIANNLISMNNSSYTAYGIYSYNSTYQNIYYNTINITRATSSSYNLFVSGSSSSNIQLQNNIFSNKGGGFAIYSDYSNPINISDYNDLYSSGSYLAYWNGNYCPTLTTWRSVTGFDVHSISILPDFISYSNLHTLSYQLDNLGYPVTGVTDDIDGQLRSLSTPDMGADEWTTPLNDAGVTSIDQNMSYCINNDTVYATIKNYGTTNLTSVTINWKLNGVNQTPKSWTGNLTQGNSYGPFAIGRYTSALGTSYSIYAWTTNPNGSPEGFTYNDSASVLNKYKAMSGTYTIGGTSPNYANFNAAIVDLVNGGVCGPVTFNVRNGIYNEQVAIPNINGTSASNTITFQSENGDSTQVTLTFAPISSYNYTLQFYGCDYVTFRKMKIIATGTTYATVIRIESYSTGNKIERCLIQGWNTTSTSYNLAAIYSNASSISNNTISQNKISDGSIGIYITGGSSTGIQILQNTIQNQYYRGMDINSLSQLTVSKNVVSSNTAYNGYEGIYLYSCGSNLILTKNKVNLLTGYYGFDLYSCTATSSTRGTIANNFVTITGSGGSAYGFYIYNNTYQSFYYNSVNLTRSISSSYCFYNGGSSASNIQLQNNIFSNAGGGYAIWTDYASQITSSDYNDFYGTSTYLAYYNGTYNPTLASWRSSSGLDPHSFNVIPGYVSATDLHICNTTLSNAAYPISSVTDDIDGQSRSLLTPDVGADEYGSAPIVNLGPDRPLCTSTVIDAGIIGAAYLWSTGAVTQTITVSAIGTYWVRVTIPCGIGYDSINITTTPATPGSITGSASVCANQTGITYSITPVSGAVTYNWTVPTGWTITSGQTTNSIIVTAASNNGNVCVTAGSGCASSSASCKSISIVTSPSTPGTITGSAGVCSAATGLSYSISSVSGATSYTWTVPTGWTITSGQGSLSINVNAGTSGGNICVTANNSCGSSSGSCKTVSILGTPSTPGSITGSTAVCASKSGLTYSITSVSGAIGYKWSVPSGWTITAGQGTISITVTSGTTGGSICVYDSNGCLKSSQSCQTVSIVGSPTTPGSISGSTTVCAGKSGLSYSVSSVSGAVYYKWTVPSGWTITAGQGTTSITVTSGSSGGNICVSDSNGCSYSSQSCQAISILGAPSTPGSITGSTAVCASKTGLTYSISSVSGVIGYKWSVPSGWTITAGQGTTSITVTSGTAGGNICVYDSNACLTSSSSCQAISITGTPSTPGSITGSTAVCASKTGLTYSITSVSGAIGYKWSVPSGWTITSGQGTISITVTSGTTGGSICVYDSNACLKSSQSCQTVSILGTPSTPGSITGSTAVCAGKSGLTYSITSVSGAVGYKWSVPSGWTITSGQGTISITVTSGTTGGNICVYDSNGCLSSSSSCQAISITGTPPTPGTITGSTAVCAGKTGLSYSISSVSGALGYKWTVPSGWTITGGQGSTSITVTSGTSGGNICVVDTNACLSSASSCQSVSILGTPSAPGAITGSIAVCANKAGLSYSISSVSGAVSYKWTVPSGWTITSGQGTTSITATSGTSGGNICVTDSNGCASSSPSCQSISVIGVPSTPGAITGSTTVCAGQTNLNYSISMVNGANGYIWTVPSGWTITSGQGTISIYVTSGTSGGNICVVDTNNCFRSSSSCQAISIQSAPSTPGTITGSNSVCPNQSGLTYYISSVSGATGYVWTVPTGWSITSGQGTTSIIVNSDTAGGDICVKASNTCSSSSAKCLTIGVKLAPPKPTPIVGQNVVCANTSGLTYSTNAISGVLKYKWTVPTGWTITSGQGTTSITVSSGTSGGDVCVNDSNTCGTGVAACLTVNIAPKPNNPGAITGPITVCTNQSGINYSISTASGATSYTWTVPTGWTIINGQGTTSINVISGTSSGNVCVTATNSCAQSSPTCVTVTALSQPAKPGLISGLVSACSGQMGLVYSISTVTDATSYTWTVPTGWTIVSGQGTNVLTVNTGSISGDVCVLASNSCGSSSSSCVKVNILTTPQKPSVMIGRDSICENSSGLIYTVAPVSDATSYLWTLAAGWSLISGQGTDSIVVNPGTSSANIGVVASNGCGTSLQLNKMVQVFPLPAKPTITQNGKYIVSSSNTGNQWYDNGTLISGATAKQYEPIKSGWYSVEVTDNNGCSSMSAAFNFIATGINETVGQLSVNLYPNPSDGKIYIALAGFKSKEAEVSMTDMMGRRVYQRMIKVDKNAVEINTGLAKGLYTVVISAGDEVIVKKLVIK